MIAAIITYLIIGGIIVRWLNRTLSDIVREETLIMKIVYYKVYGGGVPQATNPGKQTNLKVLCPPGTEHM